MCTQDLAYVLTRILIHVGLIDNRIRNHMRKFTFDRIQEFDIVRMSLRTCILANVSKSRITEAYICLRFYINYVSIRNNYGALMRQRVLFI